MPHPANADIMGETLSVGDFIVYAAHSGDSPVMKVGLIIALEVKTVKHPYRSDEEASTIQAISLNYWSHGERVDVQNSGRPVTLTMPEKMCRIEAEQVRPEWRTLLTDARKKYETR